MSLTQLLRILWARKFLFAVICCAVAAATTAAGLLLPKKYMAESAVVVDVNSADPLAQQGSMPQQSQTTYLATQLDVVASRNVALKVVDRLDLQNDADFVRAFTEAAQEQASRRDWIADALLNSLSIRSSRNGSVIYIQYFSTKPRQAAQIADAFADSYIQTSVELKVDPARRQSGWFTTQVDELRKALEQAQQNLSAYQSQHGVIGSDDARLDVENARLEELSNQLVTAQSTMYETAARAQQMNAAGTANRPDELADVMKSPLLQNLKTELARAEAKFADISQRTGRNHPQYLSAAAELAALQKKVAAEIDNTRGTVTREATIARQRVTDLQQALEQQRTRILSLKSTQDDYAVLKRDAESARTAYDAALQRSGETRLESRLDHTNVAILNYATTPRDPVSPRPILNLMLALLLGPLLAAAICTALEMRSFRVHSRSDVLDNGLGPVLAEIPARGMSLRHGRRRMTRQTNHPPRHSHVEPAL